mmetsp:Transcript_160042/g.509558  ORF Transcript_160042/g.509558 Transcript_160042/m.509558 type:complete len:470 (+) Transcript_160042:1153-2562(+)
MLVVFASSSVGMASPLSSRWRSLLGIVAWSSTAEAIVKLVEVNVDSQQLPRTMLILPSLNLEEGLLAAPHRTTATRISDFFGVEEYLIRNTVVLGEKETKLPIWQLPDDLRHHAVQADATQGKKRFGHRVLLLLPDRPPVRGGEQPPDIVGVGALVLELVLDCDHHRGLLVPPRVRKLHTDSEFVSILQLPPRCQLFGNVSTLPQALMLQVAILQILFERSDETVAQLVRFIPTCKRQVLSGLVRIHTALRHLEHIDQLKGPAFDRTWFHHTRPHDVSVQQAMPHDELAGHPHAVGGHGVFVAVGQTGLLAERLGEVPQEAVAPHPPELHLPRPLHDLLLCITHSTRRIVEADQLALVVLGRGNTIHVRDAHQGPRRLGLALRPRTLPVRALPGRAHEAADHVTVAQAKAFDLRGRNVDPALQADGWRLLLLLVFAGPRRGLAPERPQKSMTSSEALQTAPPFDDRVLP